MKKILFISLAILGIIALRTSVFTMQQQPHREYSIADYLDEHPMPTVDEYGTVDLEKKGITSLQGIERLAALVNMNTLYLNGNKIQEVPGRIFERLVHLKSIDLESNQITVIHPEAFIAPKLIEVHLYKNQIAHIPENAVNADLESLNLGGNRFQSIPVNVLKPLTKLTYLSLDKNLISNVPPQAFNTLTNLESLHLDHNQIQRIPLNTFDALKKLEMLDLGNNPLGQLPIRLLKNQTELTMLDAAHIGLTRIPELDHLKKLRDLDLSNNRIREVPNNIFIELPSLSGVNLANNQIYKLLPQSFSTLETVMDINLSNNLIQKIDNHPFNLHLQHLNIENNQIASIDTETFLNFENFLNLKLSGNQLRGTVERFREEYKIRQGCQITWDPQRPQATKSAAKRK